LIKPSLFVVVVVIFIAVVIVVVSPHVQHVHGHDYTIKAKTRVVFCENWRYRIKKITTVLNSDKDYSI